MFNIVLIEPEIPQNAGNILRTAMATSSKVYFVKPLGFSLDDKHFKRAGMDYLKNADFEVIDSFEDLLSSNPDKTFYFATTKAQQNHTEVQYNDGDFIVFGKESFGIRESILKEHMDTAIRIPMNADARSLNLSNSVAIVVYEALRQTNFKGLLETGQLTGRID